MGTDIDNGTNRQDDESQHNQQPNQVGVKNCISVTIKITLVVSEQDHGANPPKIYETTQMMNSLSVKMNSRIVEWSNAEFGIR